LDLASLLNPLVTVMPPNQTWKQMKAMTVPIVREEEFDAVETWDEEEMRRRFGPFITKLHAYLNELNCLRDLQKVRRKKLVRDKKAFGNPIGVEPRHWYTYHIGGRSEAQFNVGLFHDHFRVGLGFEFTSKEHGQPAAVQLAYACFLNTIRSSLAAFEEFVRQIASRSRGASR